MTQEMNPVGNYEVLSVHITDSGKHRDKFRLIFIGDSVMYGQNPRWWEWPCFFVSVMMWFVRDRLEDLGFWLENVWRKKEPTPAAEAK